MNIAYVTEAETDIGYGHLYRSIALAQEFISNGLDVDFFCDSFISHEIIVKHFSKTKIFETFALDKNIQKYNLVIIDVYKNSWINYKWLTQLSQTKTACIIDYTFKEYAIPADFIFQIGFQEYRFKETIIQNENGKISKIYSGNDFFIFRKEFNNERTFEVKKYAKRILVSMGGSDPYKLTEQVAEALELLQGAFQINYILGAGMSDNRVENIKNTHRNSVHKIQFFRNNNNVAKIMLNNDIAIINGGNTRFELAIIGVPFISIAINKKQAEISNKIAEKGIGTNIGVKGDISSYYIASCIYEYVNNHKLRKYHSIQMKNKIEISGKSKIFEIICNEK